MANESKKPALYLAEYDTPNALAWAAMKVRDAGYQSWDCHTPYPMHGLDEAMGLKPTRINLGTECSPMKHSGRACWPPRQCG